MRWRRLNRLVLSALSTLMIAAPAFAQAPAAPSCGQKPQVSGFPGQIVIATQQRWFNGPFQDRSLMIWDLTNQASAVPNTRWYQGSPQPTQPYSHPMWDVKTLGDVFGLAMDKNGDIYVAATRIYGSANNGLPATGTAAARAGRIYRINGATGVPDPTPFAQLPNDNNGLGSLDYDPVHDSLYVSNFHDGKIWRVDMAGALKGSWDHGPNLPTAVNLAGFVLNRPAIVGFDGSTTYAALGRRPWAVRVHQNRLFYSIVSEFHWRGGNRPNFHTEIWSVGLDAQGDPVGPARLEIQVPVYSSARPYTNPVAGMSFSPTGKLRLAERTISGPNSSDAHLSRILEYSAIGGGWIMSPPSTYEVGRYVFLTAPTNAAGGVDLDLGANGRLWGTADALHFIGLGGDTEYIYGLQGFPQPGGGSILNSLLIDLNDEVTQQNKLQLGDVRVPCPPVGQLKVCKVAGPGVAVGAPFTFTAGSGTAGSSTFMVPAGPAPGGTCVIGPSFPVGSTVTVMEFIPLGHLVTDISVAPPGQVMGAPNLTNGAVNVTIGSGVTEVTYTDARTGYLEICKRSGEPAVSGNFTFYVNGTLGPFVVPVGACSPAIQLPPGTVTITEVPVPGTTMVGCETIPAGRRVGCSPALHWSSVSVEPGDVSQQTIAIITNRRGLLVPSPSSPSAPAEGSAPGALTPPVGPR